MRSENVTGNNKLILFLTDNNSDDVSYLYEILPDIDKVVINVNWSESEVKWKEVKWVLSFIINFFLINTL